MMAGLLTFASSALGFYYPPGNTPPGPPPNYNQIDTLLFAGVPVLPEPPPDSGGFYIWTDGGQWNVANHIYSKGGSLEQFHGSILATMSAEPELNVNVFIDNFEFWPDTSTNQCLDQNDRWGWVQWNDSLYEIWWDVTTKDFKDPPVDANDFLKVTIDGCALDFNLWTSGHRSPFTLDQVFLGASMTPLSDVVGYTDTNGTFIPSLFVDTYTGISDPYQSQAGTKPANDPNITIFTAKALPGKSYNLLGEILPGDSYACDATYGARYSGAFAYEGNGIQFSTRCDVVCTVDASCPGDTNMTVCDLSPICLPGFICTNGTATVTGGSLSGDTVCFTPVEGVNTITMICSDVCGADTCSTDITVTLAPAAVATCPGDMSMTVCDLSDICIDGFSVSGGTPSVIGGILNGTEVCFTPVEGDNVIKLISTNECGADTCETVVNVTLGNSPVASCPDNVSMTVCDLSDICIDGFSCSGGAATVIGGTLNGTEVCFTPVEGDNIIKLICTNECGADTCETVVNVTLTAPAIASCPNDTSLFVCDLSEICIDGFSASGGAASVIGGTLNGPEVCFTPVEGDNVIKLISTNECGADTCEVTVNVTLNSAPVASCPGDMELSVCDLSYICIGGFSCSDADGNLASYSVTGDTLAGDTACFLPVEGVNTITLICTDSCGLADTCVTTITVTLNRPPVATCPGDISLSVCDLSELCIGGFSCIDPDDNILGSQDDSICFIPVEGANVLTYICEDVCGAKDTCQITVTVALNSPPVATCPQSSSVSVCDLSEICIDGFSCSDADGNLASTTVTGGTLNGTEVCFIPVEGANTITIICTDSCGAADTCVTTVNVSLVDPPVASCPDNVSMTVCDLSEICIDGFSCTGGTASVIGGTLNDTEVCFTPVEGDNVIKLICTNECGADTCETVVNVTLIDAPVASCPDDQTVSVCDLNDICIDGFSCTGGTASVIGGTLSGDTVCFTPVEGDNIIKLICTNECGAADTCEVTITVDILPEATCKDCPKICIDTITALPNSDVTICLRAAGGGLKWGGFDFLLKYDLSALSFLQAAPGQFLIDCEWEYFTYRIVQGGTGLIRLIAIADMNNSNQHPSCLAPVPGDELACLTFHTSNDRTLACLDALVEFYWTDCGDNSVSNPNGDTLYIGGSEPGSMVTWEGFDLTGQPGVGGPPQPCPSDKGEPLPCVTFCNGKVRIICSSELTNRGDLNLNNVAYEIADAVLYSLYFIKGPSSFGPTTAEAQIAASDINADGVVLTVADLVYLIRVITGDVQPVPENLGNGGPKVASVVGRVKVSVSSANRRMAVNTSSEHDIGAGLFVFSYEDTEISDVALSRHATDMTLSYSASGGELRVLLFNIEDRARIAAGSGEIFEIRSQNGGAVKLVSVDAATFAGGTLAASISAEVLPSQFTLKQNYPNPFNPSTQLSAEFPYSSEYEFSIYNISGQRVRSFAGQAEAGVLRIQWDGRNSDGEPVASGVYFYRLRAGEFESVRKMILMK